jgi:hypothetical protein
VTEGDVVVFRDFGLAWLSKGISVVCEVEESIGIASDVFEAVRI